MQNDIMQEIKMDVKELVKQGAIHNTLLQQHEARSLALQAQQEKIEQEIAPIKTHVYFVDLLLKGLGVLATGVAVQWAIKSWLE